MEDLWENGTWDKRLLQLKKPEELTPAERAAAHNLISALPEDRRELAVPKDREVAVLALRELLEAKAAARIGGAGLGPGSTGAGDRQVLEAIRKLHADFNRRFAGTVVASRVTVEELEAVRQVLKVKVIPYIPEGEDDVTLEEVAALLEEQDGFKWGTTNEHSQAKQYQWHLDNHVQQALRELQGRQPPEVRWQDAENRNHKCLFAGAPFPLNAKNDEVLIAKSMGLDTGAILGVELKKKVFPEMLRQMEVEFYAWDMYSHWPFCQMGMDLNRGGAALWYEGYDGNAHILRSQVFKGSAPMYTFIAQLIMGLPSRALNFHKRVADLQPGERMVPESLPSPKRKKLMGNGGVYPLARGGLELNNNCGDGGNDPEGSGNNPEGSGNDHRGASTTPQLGDAEAGAVGPSNVAQPQPSQPATGTGAQNVKQALGDRCGQDQYPMRKPIPWANVNPVIRKVVQLLHECQAEDDVAVLEDVDDPAPYLAWADVVAQDEAVPEAP